MVISKGCLDCLQISLSGSIDFCVSTALSVSNEKHEFVENLVITVRPVIKGFPALVLNGAHFDLLLGVNWIERTNARLDVANWKVYFGSVPVELGNAAVFQVELLVTWLKVLCQKLINFGQREVQVVYIKHKVLQPNEYYLFAVKKH